MAEHTASTLGGFLAFSCAVTGYSRYRLMATGQAEAYYRTLEQTVGEEAIEELLQAWGRVEEADGDEEARERMLREQVLENERLGPIARGLIKLWYTGTWYQMPAPWREAFGVREQDTTFVVSPAAYTEGLLWPTVGANPSGAKGPGYGTWAAPPDIETP